MDPRADCWEGERAFPVEVWVTGRFESLLLIGRSEGVWCPAERVLLALARDADLSSARILSRACFSSVSV